MLPEMGDSKKKRKHNLKNNPETLAIQHALLTAEEMALAKCKGEKSSRYYKSKTWPLIRHSEKNPYFVLNLAPGVKLASYVRKSEPYFIGTLTLGPHSTLPKDQAPQGEVLNYFVLKGKFLVTLSNKEFVLHEGECFSLDCATPYELYNSDQIWDAVAALFCLPSFL